MHKHSQKCSFYVYLVHITTFTYINPHMRAHYTVSANCWFFKRQGLETMCCHFQLIGPVKGKWPLLSYKAPCLEKVSELGLTLCYCNLEIFNSFCAIHPTLSFCTGPCKWWIWNWPKEVIRPAQTLDKGRWEDRIEFASYWVESMRVHGKEELKGTVFGDYLLVIKKWGWKERKQLSPNHTAGCPCPRYNSDTY